MTSQTHREMVSLIWDICNLLRGPYKRNEYRKVILPLTVLRRFDCILAPTKAEVLRKHAEIKSKPESVVQKILQETTKHPFYNLSKMDFSKLLDDPNQLAPNLNSYINSFSPNVRSIMDRFAFDQQVARMAEKNLLYQVIKRFSNVNLSPERINNHQMGLIFEELIRIGAEQANEEAGEHFTPREVIKLMVNLLLCPEEDLSRSHVVKMIYDPACGTGGMLSVAENYIHNLNAEASPKLFGQDWNDEAFAVCKSDMLIKGQDEENIRLGDTFTEDKFDRYPDNRKYTFDYMLANPPFGVEWKQQEHFITREKEQFGFDGRFGAGLPRINDGALLFLQHMISKMRQPNDGGSRIAIVFNGSPLFTGDAGSGESNIRQWIIEHDWLEAVVGLPDQLFYNTGISTYIWVLTNRKNPERKGKIQLIDGRLFFVKMRKSLGQKRHKIGDPNDDPCEPDHIKDITRIFGHYHNGELFTFSSNGQQKERIVSKVFDNEDFGYHKIIVERPLRLNFQASVDRIARIEDETTFKKLETSTKKNGTERAKDIEKGKKRQDEIRTLLRKFAVKYQAKTFKDRSVFLSILREIELEHGLRLSNSEIKSVVSALSERDETAEICRDKEGNPEPDPDLRDTESIPLKENIEDYFTREVLPHIPDAWIDHKKTVSGYVIPFNRHFYVYEPPRSLDKIEADISNLEREIFDILKEVTE